MTERYLDLYEEAAQRRAKPARPACRVQAETLTDDGALCALGQEWEGLYGAAKAVTPFQCPTWVLAARRHFHQHASLHALAVRRGGALIGVLPLERQGGRLSWIAGNVSDRCDLLAAPGHEAEAAAAAVEHLAAEPGFQQLDLCTLDATSPLVGCAAPPGCRDEISEDEATPIAPLPLARAPGKLARYGPRLAREGAVGWRVATADDAAPLVAKLVELHRSRWNARGLPGVLDDPSVQRFHLDVAPRLARAGLLRLLALTLNERVIAVFYGFALRERWYCYLCGFDPALAALNLGTLLVGQVARTASDEGARSLDFLRGREPYKYTWGAVDRPAFRRVIRVAGGLPERGSAVA